MKMLTIKYIVCIMVGIANQNYMKRPNSNSYFYLKVREHQGMLLGHVQDL